MAMPRLREASAWRVSTVVKPSLSEKHLASSSMPGKSILVMQVVKIVCCLSLP